MIRSLILAVALLGCTACTQVKPWEKELLALDAMQIDDAPVQRFERNDDVYREGAIGGNGGKSGGGCGCS